MQRLKISDAAPNNVEISYFRRALTKIADAAKTTARAFRYALPLAAALASSSMLPACEGSKGDTSPNGRDASSMLDGPYSDYSDSGTPNGRRDGGMDEGVSLSAALIAFHGTTETGQADYDVYIGNQNAKSVTNLTGTSAISERDLAFSPDGMLLAFGGDRLYVMAYPDGEPVMLADMGANQILSSVSFSPDGTIIAFSNRNPDTAGMSIYRINADGSGLTGLYEIDGSDKAHSPAFSPDGERIAFILNLFVYSGGPYGIYTMRPDGSDLMPLLEGDVWDANFGGFGSLAWSPDGTVIFFTEATYLSSGGPGVFAKEVDSAAPPTLVTSTANKGSSISFSPDGTIMLFAAEFDEFFCCDIIARNMKDGSEIMLIPHFEDVRGLGSPSWYPLSE